MAALIGKATAFGVPPTWHAEIHVMNTSHIQIEAPLNSILVGSGINWFLIRITDGQFSLLPVCGKTRLMEKQILVTLQGEEQEGQGRKPPKIYDFFITNNKTKISDCVTANCRCS